jgi:hypothetical protein
MPDAPALTLSGGGVAGEGDDFATTVLGDPWDMSEPSDVLLWNDFPNAGINNGVFSYNLPSTFWAGVPLLLPSGSQIDVGKIGALYPIDTSRYRMAICAAQADRQFFYRCLELWPERAR